MTSAGRRALLALAALSLIVVVILAAGGGVRASAGGFRLSARSPLPAMIVAAAAALAWAGLARAAGAAAADLGEASAAIDRRAGAIIAAIAATSGAFAVANNTFAGSGADASGYLSQAALVVSDRMWLPDALTSSLRPDAGPWATVPLGWRPAVHGYQVPTYPPGLPLLMAIPYALAGTIGAALVVPFATAVATLSTGAVARGIAGGAAGILAALLIAVCPPFLYQSLQPMSDVPVTAAWMLCWWMIARQRPLAAGFAAAAAILIRPNLAPVAIVPAIAVISTRLRSTPAVDGGGNPFAFLGPIAVTGAAIALLQWTWYGSPLSSGYGTASDIFSTASVWPNVKVYTAWLVETQPVLLLAPLALIPSRLPRRQLWFATAFIAAIAGSYLVYRVFENWTYLRFLLPALAMAAVMVGTLGARVTAALPIAWRAPALLALAVAVFAQGVLASRSHDVLGAADFNRRWVTAGPYLEAALPPGAVIIAGEQSGAVRHYTGHDIVRWEALGPHDLGAILEKLAVHRRPVWWVLDQWEEPLVRARFAGAVAAALDWPPVMEAGPARTTRAWRLDDREVFLTGRRGPTDHLR